MDTDAGMSRVVHYVDGKAIRTDYVYPGAQSEARLKAYDKAKHSVEYVEDWSYDPAANTVVDLRNYGLQTELNANFLDNEPLLERYKEYLKEYQGE